MPTGICNSYYKFKVRPNRDVEFEYHKVSTTITEKYGIPRNTMYSIINKSEGRQNARKYIDFEIEKCKIPATKIIDILPE